VSVFFAVVRRDVTLALRAGGGAIQTALFFALFALVFALAVGPDRAMMARLAGPILWAGALFSATLSLDRLFQADFEDGSLDVLVETSDTLALRVLAKTLAHWLTAVLPLIAIAPALALLLNLPSDDLWPLLASLLVGTPALSLVGAVAAAVTLPLRRAGALLALLTAPLYAPALIFGVGAAQAGAETFGPAMLLLAATTLFAATFAPLAAAAAIRFNLA
jgi:heme exporter protein B